MNKDIYGLYKQIMKRKPNAIDEIETLEEAKEIIKMITGNLYLNSTMYQVMYEYYSKEENK